jgi:hypothetical protein
MWIKEDYSFEYLQKNVWSGAVNTMRTIENEGKEDSLMNLLCEVFGYDDIPTLTQVNDFLWFESDFIYENLGIAEEEEEEE